MVGAVRSLAAEVRLDVRAGSLCRVRLEAPSQTHGELAVRPTASNRIFPEDMERALTASGGRRGSQKAAAGALGISRDSVGRALVAAVETGLIVEERQANGNFT